MSVSSEKPSAREAASSKLKSLREKRAEEFVVINKNTSSAQAYLVSILWCYKAQSLSAQTDIF